MTRTVDMALFEISSSQGVKLCRMVDSIEIDDEDGGLETVKTMNPERVAVGYKSGISDVSFTITHKITYPREVDYQQLKDDEEQFQCLYQEMLGKTNFGDRFNLSDCRVKGISKGFSKDGDAADVVSCMALKHRKEPA